MATLYEKYITGDNGAANIAGVLWDGQTFTPSTAHLISSVKLKWYRFGSPGTITVAIRATSGAVPTGADLTSGTYDGNTLTTATGGAWYEITLDSTYSLLASTKYAIVVSLGGDASNYLAWRVDSVGGAYAGGQRVHSPDSGVSWVSGSPYNGQDFMFEEWGSDSETSATSVTTQAVTVIDTTTATGNGNVTNLGAPAATQYGHVWATFPHPTIDNYTGITTGGVPTATGAFTSSLTGLEQNRTYYCRAYITNSIGTFYGVEVSFTTLAGVPVVTTELVTKIASTTAQGNGSIDNNGGSSITQHGVCWSTSANPTTADSKTTRGATSVLGTFTSLMTGLTAGTLYHVRTYATNSAGTGYGADVSFTTFVSLAPIVTTQLTTSVQATTATGNGTLVDVRGSAVTEHGHCWSTSANPTTADSKTTNGAATAGAFTSAIIDLTAGTTYYIRAYATNTQGTSYGDNDVINEVAGEVKGNIATLAQFLVYTDKFGTQRSVLGDIF